ncbi:phosphatase PAP2 family protein [Vibrio sp. JPW-9-11-11]|uniref:phosphatase PAP2 family protein n=1 Tax=Vibrio sp. JPW-9-11-11 TaxID=1416532 RepID=UPI0015934BD0|nr:phosphatase PAP2 family protein [Vibrio sp. JPW-9-11-11]NVD07518.1 phosphatase PAP2 family protein [Vibrio sp. JPW-9-11-11]
MRSIEPIAKFDLAFSLFCLTHKFAQPISRLSKSISHTGDGHLYVLLGLVAYFLGESEGKHFVAAALLAFVIELPVYWLCKNLFKRRRPQELSELVTSYITPSDRYSLPSGHTAAAFLMATMISHFYPEMSWFVLAWASLIGAARVLLGVHFLTDVLLGALLGLGCAQLAFILLGG